MNVANEAGCPSTGVHSQLKKHATSILLGDLKKMY